MRLLIALILLLACRPPVGPTDRRSVHLSIAAINDFHGALYEAPLLDSEEEVIGGLPWLAAAVEELRREDPELVLLDGGDLFQGSWPVNATRGRGSVEAFNLLGVDAAAVGNHEFDHGGVPGRHPLRGALHAAAEQARFAWLSANIRQLDASGASEPWAPPGIQPWAMIERKGVQLGVIGLSTTDTPTTTLPRHVADLRFDDPVQTVRELAPALRAKGADAILVVGHLTGSCKTPSYLDPGEPCAPDGEVGRLLEELEPGTIDVLVAGHAHALLAQRSGQTFVLANRAHGRVIGMLDLVIGPEGVDVEASRVREPWALTHLPSEPGCEGGSYDIAPQDVGGRELSPSIDAISLVRALEGDAGSLCDPVACTEHRVLRRREGESALGNLVADAMRAAFAGAEVALTNAGGLRDNLPSGVVRREDVVEVMPFDNRLLLVEMSGAQLERALRIGASGAHGMLQVSGASYAWDPEATGGEDLDGDGAIETFEQDRLCEVRVRAAPLEPERRYRVVTTDFLHEGGDDLGPAMEGAKVLEDGPLLRDHLADWWSRQERCLDSEPLIDPEAPRLEPRPACRAPGPRDPEAELPPTPDPDEL